MTIAVTAVTGQLGASIARALIAMNTGETIIGLARTPEKAKGLGIEVRPGDYNAPAQLEPSLEGVDTLLLVSGMDAPDTRIVQHRNVINAAKAAGVSKIVYTSVQGADEGTSFSPVIQSNRQTESDVKDSGLDWVIGRNGIYIEPDVEYIESYRKAGEITNCAGDGRCGYTTRPELAYAYARMLTGTEHNGQTYNLHGDCLTQAELAAYLNSAFATKLVYRAVSVEDYKADRIAELGDFIGTVISGIYQGIRDGALDNPSDFKTAAGRPHQDWDDYFTALQG
ncbi:Quinone oxidoreductase 2 [Thalassovita gelatinovora]|uniref:Quinone oxidoreductase 2 n=1 Tax=Thalassovita gelatinovora TaxID=53501 RepID=A0A0P1FHA7_THAGE|nr:SDR family oxidoreductase [Thalassovita gelatinovora]QIZ81979.1 SDR family oxidoreductase [Thalassovita gelatinovora]CUH67416.1 Quinone oxidoreductase 2 [Thalassovita gelatinovora]SEP74526.1 NAD(P)H dehydrogenase (quinone) [Thalassovita gelatinovora]